MRGIQFSHQQSYIFLRSSFPADQGSEVSTFESKILNQPVDLTNIQCGRKAQRWPHRLLLNIFVSGSGRGHVEF